MHVRTASTTASGRLTSRARRQPRSPAAVLSAIITIGMASSTSRTTLSAPAPDSIFPMALPSIRKAPSRSLLYVPGPHPGPRRALHRRPRLCLPHTRHRPTPRVVATAKSWCVTGLLFAHRACALYNAQDFGTHRIRKIDLGTSETTTLAGSAKHGGFNDGSSTSAQFKFPFGIAIDRTGSFALVAVRAWPASPRRALLQTAHPHLPHTPQLYPFLKGAW